MILFILPRFCQLIKPGDRNCTIVLNGKKVVVYGSDCRDVNSQDIGVARDGSGVLIRARAKQDNKVFGRDFRARLHYVTKPCDIGCMTVWSLLIMG